MNQEMIRARRDLDIAPFESAGGRLFVVRDRLGLITEPLALTEEMMRLVVMLWQGMTKQELALALTRQRGGALVLEDEVDRLLDQLDRALLLESKRVHDARAEFLR
ncbi:MAG: hypothetical protein ACUVWX_11310, partial [Kiritimatiellia bacterium]